MSRPKLRQLNPAARARSVSLGAPVRVLGAAPAVKVTLSFYLSKEWRDLVRKVTKARGKRCEAVNCRTPHRGQGRRIFADHIIELRDGGAPLDERNVMLMCASCHGIKTVRAREARAAREVKADRDAMVRRSTMLHRNTGAEGRESGSGGANRAGSSLESAPNQPAFFSGPGGRR